MATRVVAGAVYGRSARRFLLRGLAAATAELTFIALTHNLLELFSGGAARMSLA